MKMEEWKECTIQEITTYKKGFAFKLDDYKSAGIKIVKVSNLNQDIYDISKYVYLDPSEETKYEDVKLRYSDVVISTVGSWPNNPNSVVGKVTKIPKFLEGCFLNQNAVIFRANDLARQDYLYYLLKDDKFMNYITGTAQGSASQASIKLVDIMNYSFLLPPLPTQQKIAAILSSLDDKIELNNKINTNLEQQAQALFKNWFVDFEPFGGKMPEEWKEIPLEELCTVVTKGTTPTTVGKKFTEVGINFIKGESILDNHTFDLQKISHIDDETNLMLKRSIIQPNDILFTIAGTLGRFAIIDETLTPANTNQAVGIIRTNPEIISPYYLYSFFIGNWHNDYYTKRIQQAVQANLSLGTIKSLPIIIPDSQNLNKYTKLIEPLFKHMKQLENENIKLVNLRDTILPKLINGEIEV